MGRFLWFLLPVVLILQCYAEVLKKHVFEADDLTISDSVTVDIQSEITGQIKWMYTDSSSFRVTVTLSSEDDVSGSTDITFQATNSSVHLLIGEKYIQYSPAFVTGTGSMNRLSARLAWFPALLFGWKSPIVILLMFISNVFTHGSEYTNRVPTKLVHIEVTAPRRFLYQPVSLYINGGKVRITDWRATDNIPDFPTCRTQRHAEGCTNCCYGHGTCVQNQCLCDAAYEQESDCASPKGQNLFFSHPVDPRLEKTLLPNGDVLTLSRAFQFIQQLPYLKNPDAYAIEIQSRDTTFSRILVLFHHDGFIDEIIHVNTTQYTRVKLKQSRTEACLLRLKGNLINMEMDICKGDSSNDTDNSILNQSTLKMVSNRESSSDRSKENGNRKKRRLGNKEKRNKSKTKSHFNYYGFENFIELPVHIERCGYKSQEKHFVYIELLKEDGMVNESRNERNLSWFGNENIVLLSSHVNRDGAAVLRLPNITIPLGTDVITSKCKMTVSYHEHICSTSNLGTFEIVCDNIFKHSDVNQSTLSHISRSLSLCRFVLKTVKSYCDKSVSRVLSRDVCMSKFLKTVNIFSNANYQIRPLALFPDEKIITGKIQQLTLGGHMDIKENELRIIDHKPDFKVVKISVFPSDPVPHDIYQVKLDYACATDQTIIKMTVSGSDFYTNHVICEGITQCSCCILHAAGAPNAVVDHVIIHVTDLSTKYELSREMVVVF